MHIHQCIEWVSNPWSQYSSDPRSYAPQIRKSLWLRAVKLALTAIITFLYMCLKTIIYAMVQDNIWKADYHSAHQKISCFLYGTRRFITVFTKARHITLSWASWIQFAPSIPTSPRSSLMLSSHLSLGLPSDQPKPCKHLSPPHVLLTSSSLI
jgi:hypothetical protein